MELRAHFLPALDVLILHAYSSIHRTALEPTRRTSLLPQVSFATILTLAFIWYKGLALLKTMVNQS